LITNGARCTREIKSIIAMEIAVFKKKEVDFTRKFKEETSELPYLWHSCVWC
jgi:hypothetical protein